MTSEIRAFGSAHAAYAAYNRPAGAFRPVETPPGSGGGRGIGTIVDRVDLSPEALAAMARQNAAINVAAANVPAPNVPAAPTLVATAPGAGTFGAATFGAAAFGAAGTFGDAATNVAETAEETRKADAATPAEENAETEKPAPSDPFRAYRGADGQISMKAMMEIEMLPPHLRTAGKLLREASSLRDEIAALDKDPAADPARLERLQTEYAGVLGSLQEELDKLGLTKKMREKDMSMDDLLNAGLEGLTALAGDDETAPKRAGAPEKEARIAETTEKPEPPPESPLSWALDRNLRG